MTDKPFPYGVAPNPDEPRQGATMLVVTDAPDAHMVEVHATQDGVSVYRAWDIVAVAKSSGFTLESAAWKSGGAEATITITHEQPHRSIVEAQAHFTVAS